MKNEVKYIIYFTKSI